MASTIVNCHMCDGPRVAAASAALVAAAAELALAAEAALPLAVAFRIQADRRGDLDHETRKVLDTPLPMNQVRR
jgi:hypothetical protein